MYIHTCHRNVSVILTANEVLDLFEDKDEGEDDIAVVDEVALTCARLLSDGCRFGCPFERATSHQVLSVTCHVQRISYFNSFWTTSA